MAFERRQGNRVALILVIIWMVCVALSGLVTVIYPGSFLRSFNVTFAICCGTIAFTFLGIRDVLSALLMASGGLILFSLTVIIRALVS
jgi:hypothetical protein